MMTRALSTLFLLASLERAMGIDSCQGCEVTSVFQVGCSPPPPVKRRSLGTIDPSARPGSTAPSIWGKHGNWTRPADGVVGKTNTVAKGAGLNLWEFENLLSDEEADSVVKSMEGRVEWAPCPESYNTSTHHSQYLMYWYKECGGINVGDNPALKALLERVSKLWAVDATHKDFVNLVRYAPGAPATPAHRDVELNQACGVYEPPHITTNIYLTDSPGKVLFPNAKVSTPSAKKGSATSWLNVDAEGHHLHSAIHAVEGLSDDHEGYRTLIKINLKHPQVEARVNARRLKPCDSDAGPALKPQAGVKTGAGPDPDTDPEKARRALGVKGEKEQRPVRYYEKWGWRARAVLAFVVFRLLRLWTGGDLKPIDECDGICDAGFNGHEVFAVSVLGSYIQE